MHVKQSVLAELFQVTARTIRDWHGEGLEAHRDPETGKYDLAGAIAWRLQRERDRLLPLVGKNGDGPSLDEARARKEHALAQLREFELAEKEGSLVPVSDVYQWVANWGAELRSAWMSLPSRYTTELAGEVGLEPGKLYGPLDGLVRRFLTDVADDVITEEFENE